MAESILAVSNFTKWSFPVRFSKTQHQASLLESASACENGRIEAARSAQYRSVSHPISRYEMLETKYAISQTILIEA